MKSVFSLFFSFLFFNLTFADEPPSFTSFNVSSHNSLYFAKVFEENKSWNLAVYNSKDSSIFWEEKYFYDGYPTGKLSNDGKHFVYVNDWLQLDWANQVCVYSKDTSYRFSGKDLGLDSASFPHTVSHQIWINKWSLNDTSILIKTLNGDALEITLKTLNSKKEKIKHTARQIELLNSIKQITILVAIFIGVGILMLLISRIKAIKKRKEKL